MYMYTWYRWGTKEQPVAVGSVSFASCSGSVCSNSTFNTVFFNNITCASDILPSKQVVTILHHDDEYIGWWGKAMIGLLTCLCWQLTKIIY